MLQIIEIKAYNLLFTRIIMKKLLVIFVFIFFSGYTFAQEFTKISEYDCGKDVQYFTGDAFGNTYILYQNGSLIRIDSLLKKTSLPGLKIMGDISIDTKNPFKIQIFNSDEQSLTFYNKEFTPTNSISFINMDLNEALLCCASSGDAFWVLEENGLNLVRYSSDLIKISETRGSELFNNTFTIPTAMRESGEFLIIWQSGGSAVITDKFGNLRWKFPEEADYYALNTPYLYFLKDSELTAYHLPTHKNTTITLPVENFEKLIIRETHFYFLKKEKILHYKLK